MHHEARKIDVPMTYRLNTPVPEYSDLVTRPHGSAHVKHDLDGKRKQRDD